MLDVKAYRPRENDGLDIASDGHEIVRRKGMIHPGDVLLDDRPLVEFRRHIMRRRADQLHAPRMGLMIRLGSLEARQERMMNVDQAAFKLAAEIGRQDLHVARENDKVDALSLDKIEQPGFLARLGLR